MNLLLFPNNLYEVKYLPDKIDKIYLLEDPVYFGFREKKMNFNKLKLVLHRASMKNYENYLKSKKLKVEYIEFNKLKNLKYSFMSKLKLINHFELNDHLLQGRLDKHTKNKEVIILDNPNFLVTTEILDKYHDNKNNKNRFFHKNFYDFIKDELNILKGVKSYDNDNRQPLPKNTKIPDIPNKKKSKFELEAISYINKLYKIKD